MNEFVTHCGRDRVPIIWFQDTIGHRRRRHRREGGASGPGPVAHLLHRADRRAHDAASSYAKERPRPTTSWAGPRPTTTTPSPWAPPPPKSTSCTGRPPRPRAFARRLVKEKESGKPLDPVIDKMNRLVKSYYDKSRPVYCAQSGLVDEVVRMTDIRRYLVAFTGAAYQNPRSICPQHQMLLPRIIKG